MKLKLIKPDDLNQITIFFTENNVDIITRSFTPFKLSPEIAQWIACELHKDRFYLGISQEMPAGFAMLRGWDEGFSIPSFGMFIDHRKHGRGLGKQLLDLTIDDAKKLQCNKIRLSVYASNSPAYKIYQSRGFVEVERSKIIINNLADEKIVMVKDLYDA